jgi:hypothetical protein
LLPYVFDLHQIAGIGDLELIRNYRDLYDPARVSAIKENKKQLAKNEIATTTAQLDVVKDTLNLNETKFVKSYNQLQNIENKKKTPALVQINNTFLPGTVINFAQPSAQAPSPELADPAPPALQSRPQALSPLDPATPQLRDKAPLSVGPVHA